MWQLFDNPWSEAQRKRSSKRPRKSDDEEGVTTEENVITNTLMHGGLIPKPS